MTRRAIAKDCPGCGRSVKRLRSGLVCGQCAANPAIVARVEATRPAPEPKRDKVILPGDYVSDEGREVFVLAVYTEDDAPVVEYRSPSGMLYYKMAADFAKSYRRAA